MREIKFRAWDKEEKKMLSVMELGFSFNVDKYNYLAYADLDGRWGRAILTPNGGKQSYSWSGQRREAEQIEIMQYTGLLDKNGKEIYEGDIVVGYFNDQNDRDAKTNPMKVVWGHSAFGLEYADTRSAPGLFSWRELEIIGNIYENPELLENK
jgi:hypothetical protein